MSDFREVRKIAPLFPDFVFLLILLLFIFQFFPFQFIFFLFDRNDLRTRIKMTVKLAFSLSIGKKGQCFWEASAEPTSKEEKTSMPGFTEPLGELTHGLRITMFCVLSECGDFMPGGDLY